MPMRASWIGLERSAQGDVQIEFDDSLVYDETDFVRRDAFGDVDEDFFGHGLKS